jgi:hypothetical protein
MQRRGQHRRSGDGYGSGYLGGCLSCLVFLFGWRVFGPHLFFPALEVFLCARLELLLLHLGVHPLRVFLSTVPAPVPFAAVVTLPITVSLAPASLNTRLRALFFAFVTATPARLVPLAVVTTWSYIGLWVSLMLLAVAVTVSAKALKVLLTQALAALDICPALPILSWHATAIYVALVAISVVFSISSPAVVLGEAVSDVVSICRCKARALLRITCCFGRDTR